MAVLGIEGRAVDFHRPPGWNDWVHRDRVLLRRHRQGEAGSVVLQDNLPFVGPRQPPGGPNAERPERDARHVGCTAWRNNLRDGIPGVAFPRRVITGGHSQLRPNIVSKNGQIYW